MIPMRPTLAVLILFAAFYASGVRAQDRWAAAGAETQRVEGLDTVTLHRSRTKVGNRPQFLSVTLLPGHGMDLFQVTADIPGHGETPLIASPSLEEAARRMNDSKSDQWSYVSYGMGAAILLPWASRISGAVSADHS